MKTQGGPASADPQKDAAGTREVPDGALALERTRVSYKVTDHCTGKRREERIEKGIGVSFGAEGGI